MERKKCFRYLAIIWLSLWSFGTLQAQKSPKERVYQALINDQMDDWDQVIVELYGRKASLSDAQLGELVNFYYGYSG